jgi:hypothetical protein
LFVSESRFGNPGTAFLFYGLNLGPLFISLFYPDCPEIP